MYSYSIRNLVSSGVAEKTLPEIYLLPLLNGVIVLQQPLSQTVAAGIPYRFPRASNRCLLRDGGQEILGKPRCLPSVVFFLARVHFERSGTIFRRRSHGEP